MDQLLYVSDEESVKKIEEKVSEKLKGKYDINIPMLVKPKIVVINIDNEVKEEDLIEVIKSQNKLSGEINLVKCYSRFNNPNKYNAIIETEKNVFKELIEMEKSCLNIGWNKCLVFDKINVKRCFNCWGFNHNAQNCTNKICCPKCSGEHKIDECENEVMKCKNCALSVEKLNINIDSSHDVRDANCPVYLRRLERERGKVAY